MASGDGSDESVTMICPNLSCQRTVCAPQTARGLVVRCAYCETPFRVPNRKADRPAAGAGAPEPAGRGR